MPNYVLATVVIGIMAIGGWVFLREAEHPEERKRELVHLRYHLLLKNTSGRYKQDSKLLIFMPIDGAGYQRLVRYDVEGASAVLQQNNHSMLEVSTGGIPPFGVKTIAATFTVMLGGEFVNETLERPELYLGDSRYLNLDSSVVISTAEKFSNGRTVEVAKNIYQWVAHNVKTVGYVARDQGAEYAIRFRKGDCTEHMYVFVALARLNGIPARGVGGFVLESDNTIVRAHDYHNWAEFYDGSRWIVVDPQERVFSDTGNRKYLKFRYLAHSENPAADRHSQRFLSFDPDLKLSFE